MGIDMTLKLELNRDQEARLRAEAEAKSTDVAGLITAWVNTLPKNRRKRDDEIREVDDGVTRVGVVSVIGSRARDNAGLNSRPEARTMESGKMTPREILAYLADDTTPSVFARSGEDAVTIGQRLRKQAERRGPAP